MSQIDKSPYYNGRPSGMSNSHYRCTLREERVQRELIINQWEQNRCNKPVTHESWCILTKGHEGDCDDIPF